MAGARAKLLLVEDNLETQLIVKVLLRKKYDLVAVNNAADAIESLTSNNFDLVLLDLHLGSKEDGRFVLSEIRTHLKKYKLPVIIVTAYDLTTDDEKFFQENANGLIQKPFDKDALLEFVNKTLANN